MTKEEMFNRFHLILGSKCFRCLGANHVFSSYRPLIGKILAACICLYSTLIGPTDARSAAAKPRVVIAHAAMNFRVAPLWVAQDQGFFSKYGIDSEVIYMRGGPMLLSGMLSGDIQVG